MIEPGYGILWSTILLHDEPTWFAKKERVARVVDAFAATRWWAELQVMGIDGGSGRPIGSPDAARAFAACGKRGRYAFARGAPSVIEALEEASCRVELGVQPHGLELKAFAAAESLDRLASACLDDVIELLAGLRFSRRGDEKMYYAFAVPRLNQLELPRSTPRPAGIAARIDAIVEMVDLAIPVTPGNANLTSFTGPIGRADPPHGVARDDRDGLVILRWVDDPRDRATVSDAASRHEAWLLSALGAT